MTDVRPVLRIRNINYGLRLLLLISTIPQFQRPILSMITLQSGAQKQPFLFSFFLSSYHFVEMGNGEREGGGAEERYREITLEVDDG